MKPFIGIIGQRESGKSSVIRSLTGVPSSGFRGYIRNRETGESIYVFASSPQEDPIDLADFKHRIRAAKNQKGCRGIVCAIQPNRPRVRISLEDVYKVVKATNGLRAFAFFINPGHGARSASSDLTADVTQRLQNFRTKPHLLNGNRFPYQNATAIEKATNLNG